MSPSRLIDDIGVPHRPADGEVRIVSLVPSLTELLFDLKLEDRMVGRTTFCVHPEPGVERVPRVGGTKTVKLEKIRRLAPTHVIVNVDENRREDVDAMAGWGCKVVVTHPIAPTDNLRLYRLIGAIFDREDAAERLCREFEQAHASLVRSAERLPRRRVLYLIWRDPWMTISEDTYISRTLALAKLDTVGGRSDIRYPQLEFEDPLMRQVDAILLSSEPFPFKHQHVKEVRRLTRRWAPPVLTINAEMVSWYGSRAISGLRYLQAFAADFPTP